MPNENAELLRHERSRRFHDAVDFRKTDRVPNLGCIVAWKILDNGYTFPDAFYDNDVMEECVRRTLEKYDIDCISDPGAGSAYQVMRAFGGRSYFTLTDHTIEVEPFSHCSLDELHRYITEGDQLLWDTILPGKFPDWNEKTAEDFQRAYDAFLKVRDFSLRITDVICNEYGRPMLSSSRWGAPAPFIETLVNPVRSGFGVSIDARRDPEKLEALIDEWDGPRIEAAVRKIESGPEEHDLDFCFDIRTVVRSSCFLSARQFERFYWKNMKRVYDACADKGIHMLILMEGHGEHVFDLFRDYSRGCLAMTVEEDPVKIRKLLPDVALVGGMPLYKLGHASVDECVSYTRYLLDNLAGDGYIFGESNFMCYPNDARAENLAAVCELVSNYRAG